MLTHAVFANLLLHDDDELSTALGARIVERQTIHEWPLSCVQRIVLADGRRLIYKSQRPPTVEASFYARAESPLLPTHRILDKLGDCDTMTIEWIDAPLLRNVAPRDVDLLAHGRHVIDAIGRIRGDLPVYLDVGSPKTWRANAATTLEKLRALMRDRRFTSVDAVSFERIASWSTSAPVVQAVNASPRVTHGDLKSDQVFVTPDGYRVIDWQRPVIAPADTDLVSLLAEERMAPQHFLDATIVRIFWFLRLCWAVEAQFDLFPETRNDLFDRWTARAARHILG